MNKIFDISQCVVFKHPFKCIIAGPSEGGKTELLFKILSKAQEIILPPPDKIIYCYSEWQDRFLDYKFINFKHGLYDTELLNPKERSLLIFDDLMDESKDDQKINNLFTKGSHHRNISIFFLTQNILEKIAEQLA